MRDGDLPVPPDRMDMLARAVRIPCPHCGTPAKKTCDISFAGQVCIKRIREANARG